MERPSTDNMTNHHPIEGLMKTAMESIKGMIDVNTVVGQPVQTHDGGTIIPISKVSLGFAAGGGEYWNNRTETDGNPFGGGSGAGVSVHPVGFLVVQGESVRLLSVDRGDVWESLANNIPQLMEHVQSFLGSKRDLSSTDDDDHGATRSTILS